jgi:hypothetical protein
MSNFVLNKCNAGLTKNIVCTNTSYLKYRDLKAATEQNETARDISHSISKDMYRRISHTSLSLCGYRIFQIKIRVIFH